MKMKIYYVILMMFFILLTSNILFALEAEDILFEFDSKKIEEGNKYVYQVSTNPQKYEPERKYTYFIKSINENYLNIEGLYKKNEDISNESVTHVTYKINLTHMMLESDTFESFVNQSEMAINTTLKAKTSVNFDSKKSNFTYTNRMEEGMRNFKSINKFERIPTFFYKTRHIDLCTMMRFYPYSKSSITVGNIKDGYYTDITIEYLGKEEVEVPCGTILCNKFKISGIGLIAKIFGKNAWIWMSDEDERGYMVKYRNENSRGNLPMIELRLSKTENMSQDEWDKYIDDLRIN